MDKLKNKYELILGFVTLVISFSAFKDELEKVTFPLGYASITAAEYLLYIVVGFGFCLYWFIMENVFRETKIGTWKIWNFILKLSYFIFALLLLTPILIALNIAIFKLVNLFTSLDDNAKKSIILVLNILTSVISLVVGIVTGRYYSLRKKIADRVEAQTQEIIELENAQKLFDNGFYSQSVLESFKVLESHLYNELTNKDIRVQKHKFNDVLKLSINEKLISEDDLKWINDLRNMRNVAAHSDVVYTMSQASQALEYVRNFLSRLRNHDI